MGIHRRVILKLIGIVMMVIGISMLPSFLVSFFCDGAKIWKPFAICIIVTVVLGFLIAKLTNAKRATLKLRDGFLLVAASWITASLVGAIPYFVTGSISSPIDCIFESVSGFSTTGASILYDVETLPRGILFWRAFTQWIGGIGILVFAVGLMPSLGISGQNVMSTDTPNLSLGKISTKMSDAIKTLYVTYIAFTMLETMLLALTGMSLYDALIHTFATVGTGGFSGYNDGIAHFNDPTVYTIIMIFMLLCGVNFNLYFLSISRGPLVIAKDVEFRFYIGAIVLISGIIAITLTVHGTFATSSESILESLFQTISIISTTGFSTSDYTHWPALCQMLLLILMFVGGCSSSTSGGVKAIRILVILRYITHGIRSRLHPNSVEPITVNGVAAPSNTITGVTYHIFLYIVMLFFGAFAISLENIDIETSFSAVITCMGNIGPAFGDIGTTDTFCDFNVFSKLILSAEMIAGRLELYTLFILFTPRFWNPNN